MLGPFGPDSDVRRWGLKMIEDGNGSKRARQRAVVGVARRLAVLLMSLWKSGQSYDPLRHSRARTTGGEARTAGQNGQPEPAGAHRQESGKEVAA